MSSQTLSYGEKNAKSDLVDLEIIRLQSKKKEINASKIYSPVGLLSGLNKIRHPLWLA